MIFPNFRKIYFYLPALAALLLFIKSPTNAFGNAPEEIDTDMKVLFEFTGADPSPEWSATNDTVMGGVSKGKAKLTMEGMDFSGYLSLENNGGFASVHMRVDLDLSDYSGIRLKVLGDGRIYQLRFESDALHRQRWPVNFCGDFETVDGEWTEVFISFSELSQTWRGRRLSGHSFSKDEIRRVAFMLADGQAGDFALKVAWIHAAH
jgi:monofunctional biosynthetic peptidoglycan transglycosylase